MDPITQQALILGGTSLASGVLSGRQSGSANRDRKMQKDFAKKGLGWRVNDAIKSGLHPLAALGANISSPSPTSVGGNKSDYGIGDAGQNIANALARRLTPEQRKLQRYQLAQEMAKAEGYRLDNDLKRKAIQELDTGNAGPGMDNFDTRLNPNSIFNSRTGQENGTQTIAKQIIAKKQPDTTAGQGAGFDDYMFGGYNVRVMNEQASDASENDVFTKFRVYAINTKKLKGIVNAFLATKESPLLPKGLSPKLQLPKRKQEARSTLAQLRNERKRLPYYRYQVWQMDPTIGWKSVPATRENRKYFFTAPESGKRVNFTPY